MPVYVITGTNRGLGLEFVRQLAASPENTVVGTVRTLQKSHDALNSIVQQRGNKNIHILEVDTGNVSSIVQFGAELEKVLQGQKIDYLINNSGINATSAETAFTLTPESLHEHIDINVIGPQKTVAVLAPQLSKDAVILNMTSGLGSMQRTVEKVASRGENKNATYSISKAGLNMLTLYQALELKDKVKAIIVMDPGWVKTDMGGAHAHMEPKDSIAGMLKVIHGLTKEDTGKYYHSSGDQVPW